MKLFDKIKTLYSNHKIKIIFSFVIMVLLFIGILYWSVEATSTPQFCIQCHEIKPAYNTWIKSTHYKVKKGKQIAYCRDCHLPGWNHPIALIIAKAYHGSKDVYHHFNDKDEFKYTYYIYNMKLKARKDLPNSNCLKCHQDIYQSHKQTLKAYHIDLKNNKNLYCVDCHKNLVH